MTHSGCMEVRSARFGQSGWERGGWESLDLLECSLRSLGDSPSKVQGSLSSKSLKVYHLCLALAAEVRWWKMQCGAPSPGGWVVLVWFGVVLLGRKDSSTCFWFPVADG